MALELDTIKTAVAFVVVIAIGTAALFPMPGMTTETILMIVVPSMVIFGLITLAIGVAHGQYRAAH